MKKVIALLLCVTFLPSVLFAQQTRDLPKTGKIPELPSTLHDSDPPSMLQTRYRLSEEGRVENLFSWDYGKLLLKDTGHILAAPFHWGGKEWLWVGAGMAAVIGMAAWGDRQIEVEMKDHRLGFNDKFSRSIQPFGAEYSIAVLGGFEAAGMIFKDENALATAHDGLSATLASTLAVTAFKYATGRDRPSKMRGPNSFRPFGGGDSFPSGHTMQAFAVASVIAEHYDSFWVKAAAYGTAALVGYARIERQNHWASDVLAGAIIGTVIGKELVKFNKNKRYQLSVYSDGDSIGLRITHRF